MIAVRDQVHIITQDGTGETVSIGITSIEELQLIGASPEYPTYGQYYLNQDLDASATAGWNDGAGFEPIGAWHYDDPDRAFTGHFDGRGHVIRNLFIHRPDHMNIGLFGVIRGGVVEELGLEDFDVTGAYNVGGIAGWNPDGVVRRSYAMGRATGVGSVAGLVGYNGGAVEDCHATGCVQALLNTSGGLIGLNDGVSDRCWSASRVVAFSGGAGGLAGENQGQIHAGFWDTETSGQDESAGGMGMPRTTMMEQALFEGAGWDFEDVWGIVDHISYPYLRWQGAPGLATVPAVVGLVGAEAEDAVRNAALRVIVSHLHDFSTPAGHVAGQHPYPGALAAEGSYVYLSVSLGAIVISDVEELQRIGNEPGYPLEGYYRLAQDIDGLETMHWNGGRGFAPIGCAAHPFTGFFGGQGHAVRNLRIQRPDTFYVGLFGHISDNAGIINLAVENGVVSGMYFTGGLVGKSSGGELLNCCFTGLVAGHHRVGGVVGWNEGGVLEGCFFEGTVASSFNLSFVGGLIGDCSGIVRQCYALGLVVGHNYAGGLIGWKRPGGVVWDSYAHSTVSASEGFAGGLVGVNYGSIARAFATGAVSGCFFHRRTFRLWRR